MTLINVVPLTQIPDRLFLAKLRSSYTSELSFLHIRRYGNFQHSVLLYNKKKSARTNLAATFDSFLDAENDPVCQIALSRHNFEIFAVKVAKMGYFSVFWHI